MAKKKFNYNYFVLSLGRDGDEAYEAIIPKFKNLHVFADTIKELDEQVRFIIDLEIKDRKKDGRPIPPEDNNTTFSGKILVRISPTLHEKLYNESQANRLSLNKYIERKLIGA